MGSGRDWCKDRAEVGGSSRMQVNAGWFAIMGPGDQGTIKGTKAKGRIGCRVLQAFNVRQEGGSW